MDISQEQQGGITMVKVVGRLDSATARELERHLGQTIDQGVEALGLDLGGLEFVSSAGLRVFLLTAKRMKAAGTPLALFGIQPQVAKVLEVSGFARILPIAADHDAALASLQASGA